MLARLSRFAIAAADRRCGLAGLSPGAGWAGLAGRSSPPRNEPLVIAPRFDEPRVVTDEQLAAVLDRVKPPAEPLKTNNMVHALRLWGAGGRFSRSDDSHRPADAGLLPRRRDFRQFAGEQTPRRSSIATGDGIAVRSYDDGLTDRDTSSYHADDLLATLAETGTPLDTPLHLRERRSHAWASCSTIRCAGFTSTASNTNGRRSPMPAMSFPQRQFAQQVGRANRRRSAGRRSDRHRRSNWVPATACTGWKPWPCCTGPTSRRHALRTGTKLKILAHMKRVSDLLAAVAIGRRLLDPPVAARHAAAAQTPSAKTTRRSTTRFSSRAITWNGWPWRPKKSSRRARTIVRAGQWLTRTLLEMDAERLAGGLRSLHARRPRAGLWRSKDPYEAWHMLVHSVRRSCPADRRRLLRHSVDHAHEHIQHFAFAGRPTAGLPDARQPHVAVLSRIRRRQRCARSSPCARSSC